MINPVVTIIATYVITAMIIECAICLIAFKIARKIYKNAISPKKGNDKNVR